MELIKKHWILLFLTLLGAFLIFKNLGDRNLWGDEAETALYARNILKTGYCSGWDGKNVVTILSGGEYNKNFIMTLQSWLQYYLAATSFLIFGENTLKARLMFALIGVLTIPLCYYFVHQIVKEKMAAIIATILLIGSTNYLLYVRQCRYYSLVILFTLVTMFFYQNLKTKRWFVTLGLALSMALLFHCNYMVFFGFLIALSGAFFAWDFSKEKLKLLGYASIGTFVATFPFFIFANPFKRADEHVLTMLKLRYAPRLFLFYLREYNNYSLFPVLLLPALIYVVIRPKPVSVPRQKILFFITILLLQTVAISVISPTIPTPYTVADIRYVINLLPIFILLQSFILYSMYLWKKTICCICMGILIFTNLFSIPVFNTGFQASKNWYDEVETSFELRLVSSIKLPFFNYLYEINTNIEDPIKAVVSYFQDRGNDQDIILVTPQPYPEPLMFYLDKKFCAMIDPKKSKNFHNTKDKLVWYTYSYEVIPDWIVQFGNNQIPPEIFTYLYQRGVRYTPVYLDTFWLDMVRPELSFHSFRTTGNFREHDKIVILNKSKDPLIGLTIDYYQNLIDRKTRFASLYNNLGAAFAGQGDEKLAELHFIKALNEEEGYPLAHKNLGILYMNKGNTDTALNHLKQYLHSFPEDTDTLQMIQKLENN